jgi:hypothetical protein
MSVSQRCGRETGSALCVEDDGTLGPPKGCCSTCDGRGGDETGPCHDCHQTGHTHAPEVAC